MRFLRDVAGDSPRADEVEDESPESYAERKRIVIDNPRRGLTAQQKGGVIMAKRLTRDDLADQVAELEEQNCPPVADSRSRLAIYGGGTATRRDSYGISPMSIRFGEPISELEVLER